MLTGRGFFVSWKEKRGQALNCRTPDLGEKRNLAV
jgi:hypothetical protein